jgi:hypothetical protein
VSHLPALIREYAELLEQERLLDDRKAALRAQIEEAMALDRVDQARTEFGSAQRMTRHKLIPRRDPVLSLLDRADLFPFATFTPAKVTEHLVPRFGRETLIPLFDIEKSHYLLVKRPSGSAP